MSTRVASLEAVITANVTGFQKAAAQVKSGLNGIAKEAKTSGGAIDGFNTKARALEESYATGAISAAQYAKQGKALAWSMMSSGEKFDIVRQQVARAGAEMLKIGGAAVGVAYAGKKIYEFAKAGAEIEYTSQKFDRLAKAAGTTGKVFLNELRYATKGTLSDFSLLKQGSDLLQLGLAKDSTEAVRLSNVMTALGMDTNEMTLALANQSKRRLDQLGLSLSAFNKIEDKLKDKGMSKEDAFKEAFLQTAEQTIATTGNKADSNVGNFMRLQAEAENTFNAWKESVPSSSAGWMFGGQSWGDVAGQLSETVKMLRQVASPNYGLKNGAWNAQTSRFEFDVQRTPQYYAEAQRTNVGSGWGIAAGINTPGGRGRQQILTADDYSQMAAHYTKSGSQQQEAAQVDYAGLLASGLDLTQLTADYKAKTVDLNSALTEEAAKLETLTKKHGENSQAVLDQKEKVNEIRSSITALGQSFEDSTESMALGMLKSKGATDEMQAAYARASGLISDDAYNSWTALDKLSTAYQNNKITADTYAFGVNELSKKIAGMNGAQANAYIDIWVRTHGSVPSNLATTNTVGSVTPGATTGQGQADEWLKKNKKKWTGGPLGAGITLVGDAPGGGMTPYTEAIINGYVIDAKTTRKLYEMGFLGGADSRVVGGDLGGTGTFTGGGSGGSGGSSGGTYHASPTYLAPHRRKKTEENKGKGAGKTEDATVTVQAQPEATALAAAVQVGAQTQSQAALNFQVSTQQTISAQRESQAAIVSALNDIESRIAKQADKNDMYGIFKGAGQTSI